jgi:hypothetical protein
VLFCHCYAEAIWDPTYHVLIYGDIQQGDAAVAGFISHLMGRHYYDIETALVRHGAGGWRTAPGFSSFVEQVEVVAGDESNPNAVEMAKNCEEQAEFFFKTASATLKPHAARWLKENVFLSLGDRKEIAVPLAKVLCAARDAQLPPAWPWAEELGYEGWRLRGPLSGLVSYIYIDPDEKEYIDEQEAKSAANRLFLIGDSVASVAERERRLMRDAVDAAIATHSGAVSVLCSTSNESQEYALLPLLTHLTTQLDVTIVRQWPLPDAALKAWVNADGDTSKLSAANQERLQNFFNRYCYGFPSHNQRVERQVGGVGMMGRGKPKEGEDVLRQKQMHRANTLAPARYAAACEHRDEPGRNLAANQYTTGGTYGNRRQRNPDDSEDGRPAKRSRVKQRSSKNELLWLARKLLVQAPTTSMMAAVRAVPASASEAARLDAKAAMIVELAGRVHRKEGRCSRRKSYMDFTTELVPKLCAKFMGKVTLKSLTSYDLAHHHLRLRGYTGWTTDRTDWPLEKLRAVFQTETVREKTGRANEEEDVIYILENEVEDSHLVPDGMSDDAVFAAAGGIDDGTEEMQEFDDPSDGSSTDAASATNDMANITTTTAAAATTTGDTAPAGHVTAPTEDPPAARRPRRNPRPPRSREVCE